MVRWLLPLLLVAAAGVGARAEEPPAEAAALVVRWLEAQNHGDFEAYRQLYATNFSGVRRSGARMVKLDRDGWLAERQRMFRKPMTVTAEAQKIEARGDAFRVTFKQTWASGKYKDTGTKQLDLVREAGALRIRGEEMLASQRDLGLAKGGRALLVWASGTAEAAAAAEEGAHLVQTALGDAVTLADGFPVVLEGGVDGVKPGEAVLALGLCGADEVGPMLDLFRQLGPRVEARPTTWEGRGDGKGCPAFRKDEDGAGQGWSWPGVAVTVPAGRELTLTVVALHRSDAQMGDFARAFEENLFLAVVKGPGRTVKDVLALKGASDFAEEATLEADGSGVMAGEAYVDEPCNGTNRHAFKKLGRSLRFLVRDGLADYRSFKDRVLERGRCSDEEKRYYR